MGRQNTTFCPEVGETEQRIPQREHYLKVVSRNPLLATNLYLASFQAFPGSSFWSLAVYKSGYYKRSKTGARKGLGTRLTYTHVLDKQFSRTLLPACLWVSQQEEQEPPMHSEV